MDRLAQQNICKPPTEQGRVPLGGRCKGALQDSMWFAGEAADLTSALASVARQTQDILRITISEK